MSRTPLKRLPPSKGTRPASCRGARVPAAPPPPHLPPPGKPFGLPQVAAMPICPGRVSTVCHLLSFFRLFAPQCFSRRVIWTLRPCVERFQPNDRQSAAGAIPPTGPQGPPISKPLAKVCVLNYNYIRLCIKLITTYWKTAQIHSRNG